MPTAPKAFRMPNEVTAAEERPNSHQRGYTRRWYKMTAVFRATHLYCRACEAKGIMTPMTDVDHIVPHRGNKELFENPNNWQALCKTCHSEKTARGE